MLSIEQTDAIVIASPLCDGPIEGVEVLMTVVFYHLTDKVLRVSRTSGAVSEVKR